MLWEKLTEEEWDSFSEINRVYSDTELLMQAQINAWANMAVAMGCAKDFGLALSEYVWRLGEKFAVSWRRFQGKPVSQVLQLFLFNMESVGYTISRRQLGNDKASARVSWLTDGMINILEVAGLTAEEGALVHNVWVPIAESIGMTFTHRKENNEVVYELQESKDFS